MRNSIAKNRRALDEYLDLIRKFPLTSIKSDEELDAAQAVLDSLLCREPLNQAEDAYLEALSDLIGVYEDEHVHFDDPGDAAVVRFLMESKGVNQGDLASDTGIGKSTISEILSGRRRLTRKQVAKLSAYFNVGQGTFTLSLGKLDE